MLLFKFRKFRFFELRQCTQKLQTDAGAVLEQRRAKLDLEVLLEASLNDEDIERTRKNAQAVLAERDRRFMKLFADYQLQKTHIARAIVDTKTADHRREEAEREAQRLQSKVERLEVLHLACSRFLRTFIANAHWPEGTSAY